MNGVHDMGGMHGMGPIHNQKDEPVYHEQDYRLSSLLSREMSEPYARRRIINWIILGY